MPPRSNPTARQVRLGTELRRLREAAGLKARDAAAFLNSTSGQMSHVELGIAAISPERVRRLAAYYACMDDALIEALVVMATDRTRGWWEEYRGVLSQVNLDVAEAEYHARYMRDIVITRIPGLLQTPDYARAVFAYMNPGLPEREVDAKVEFRMRRRTAVDGDDPVPYEAIIHEIALRLRVSGREVSRAQLRQILDLVEQGHATVRVIPIDQDGFAGSGASMMYAGGPIPQLDTVLRDSPAGVGFIDAEAQLNRLRTLIHRVEEASLDPMASRDFIHRLAKEI
ncbi:MULTISPECIES: helix-turn-helix transcriptional regulator [unclassified Streptomyces]|uniref:helix-turn-helix domain-containing protein n=1 Tax=unclassified Streptomyces TaxID=2593676 RepID=UPI00224F3F20|nr:MULTISPECIES: helix-turn-helix transcriptional regulator [unclassified Streptomyces]MCX5286420.1 helix-turn-helix domain-containing protein [Streptomyces sp. NBC_00183]